MNEKILYARPQIEFISYDGQYPHLCSGTLVIEVAGKRYFLKDILRSGGTVRPLSYDYVAETGDWYIEPEDLPEEIRPYTQDIERLVNLNVEKGCCGGCI